MSNFRFWQTLFDAEEYTCFTANVYGIKIWGAQHGPHSTDEFFCINPLSGTRMDANVAVYRNILCEFDLGTLTEQLRRIEDSKVPYTSLVYSGGKSVHMIISLEEPVPTEQDYRNLVKAVHNKFPTVDRAASNPSRLSRCPDIIRADRGTAQHLIYLGYRIPNQLLLDWLGLGPTPEPILVPKLASVSSDRPLGLSIFADHFLRWGNVDQFDTYKGNFNNTLLKVAMEMARKGYTKSEAIAILMGVCGYLKKESFSTIDSAYRRAQNDTRD